MRGRRMAMYAKTARVTIFGFWLKATGSQTCDNGTNRNIQFALWLTEREMDIDKIKTNSSCGRTHWCPTYFFFNKNQENRACYSCLRFLHLNRCQHLIVRIR